MSQQAFSEVVNLEHISDRDGENINAKRIGLYGYDYSGSQWRRLAVNASGSLLAGTVTSLTGTANQVLANGTSGSAQTGAITLTTPQDIATGSSPTFAGLTVSGLASGHVIFTGGGGALGISGNLNWDGTSILSGKEFQVSQTQTSNTFTFTNARAVTAGSSLQPSADSTARAWGLFFGGSTDTSFNCTDGNAANGMEGNGGATGSGNTGGVNGALMYGYNNGIGTVANAMGAIFIGNSNGSTGHITISSNVQAMMYAPAFTANSQKRFSYRMTNAMPDPGGFTGCISGAIGFDYASTSPNDGINWNNDTIVYRGGTSQLNITGKIVGSTALAVATTVTAPTSVISPTHTSLSAAMTVQPGSGGYQLSVLGGAGLALGGNGGLAKVAGGNAAGFTAFNGGNVTLQGGAKSSTGTPGSVITYRSDGTTSMLTVNDTTVNMNNAGLIVDRAAVNDVAYTVLATDYIVAYTAITAARAVTLPAPAAGNVGQTWIIKDEAGVANTWNLTVTGAAGNIDGAANKVINTAYGVLRVYSNGTNYFTW